MVISQKGKRPHLVTQSTRGKYSCDSDCPNWKSLSVCSHTVAVAHVNGQLQEFCDHYRRSKRLPNVSKLVLTGLPGGASNKGNCVTRKRKYQEITSRITLPASTTSLLVQNLPGPSFASSAASPQDVGASSTTILTTSMQAQSLPGTTPSPQASPPAFPWASSQLPLPPPNIQWNTNVGSVHLQSPVHMTDKAGQSGMHAADMLVASPQYWYSPSYPVTLEGYPQNAFHLCFRSGNISVCNGCRNKFNKQAKPPLDLCIRHQEWHSFMSPVLNQPDSRFGNAYYLANPACVLARHATFCPWNLLIAEEVRSRL